MACLALVDQGHCPLRRDPRFCYETKSWTFIVAWTRKKTLSLRMNLQCAYP